MASAVEVRSVLLVASLIVTVKIAVKPNVGIRSLHIYSSKGRTRVTGQLQPTVKPFALTLKAVLAAAISAILDTRAMVLAARTSTSVLRQ